MTPDRLGALLGAPPTPVGTWADAARYTSPALLHPREGADLTVEGLRSVDGVAAVETQPNGLLLVTVTLPGEHVAELEELPHLAWCVWPDRPRTWDNPGFVVKFAYARAVAVARWAARLDVPMTGFRPELLDAPEDRAVLRRLAELPSRRASRDPRWASFAQQLAGAYHDAHEHAPAIPAGDEPVCERHTARLWLARAVRIVLAAVSAEVPPDRL
ncbi:hypothetical protein Aph01nite_40220 [Acrocarpospora phusangensis]|uniref:DALR anticodon binding domain-containing protein n=1 Tax=Acrocarpospora phusangensis TaxID=1070424 RepID=A0A919UPI3_9ACTN|nr:DALR anticodon-binding domain-containing protein [Acrocarpospora phusangensis]GIH25712.1 hypothetical protein Aph01nite_40220 [Acrocarpospora phusangensis]